MNNTIKSVTYFDRRDGNCWLSRHGNRLDLVDKLDRSGRYVLHNRRTKKNYLILDVNRRQVGESSVLTFVVFEGVK